MTKQIALMDKNNLIEKINSEDIQDARSVNTLISEQQVRVTKLDCAQRRFNDEDAKDIFSVANTRVEELIISDIDQARIIGEIDMIIFSYKQMASLGFSSSLRSNINKKAVEKITTLINFFINNLENEISAIASLDNKYGEIRKAVNIIFTSEEYNALVDAIETKVMAIITHTVKATQDVQALDLAKKNLQAELDKTLYISFSDGQEKTLYEFLKCQATK